MDNRILSYYKRKDVQQAMCQFAQDKEIGVLFSANQFGKRPDVIVYPTDVEEFAKQGATSFHCSEELWQTPLSIRTGMRKQELDAVRKGWDLILDIDCKFLEYSKIAADLLVKAIQSKGVECVTAKFSGNHGFHIAVPFEAFPAKAQTTELTETKNYFPDGVRIIASYLKEMIREPLAQAILVKEDIGKIAEKTQKPFDELVKENKFDPFSVLEIDSILLASRHLYRMPYSLNEKSGLVSIPVDIKNILSFEKEEATIENVKVGRFPFLDRCAAKENEALHLFDDALAWASRQREKEVLQDEFTKQDKAVRQSDFQISEAIPRELFPPCIKAGLGGIADGKKRFLFALLNFLSKACWNNEQITTIVEEWNKKNPEPLRETYMQTQVRYHLQRKEKMLPPNCRSFYQDMRICSPDGICEKIKNPLNYSMRRVYMIKMQENEKPKREKKKEKVQKEKKQKKEVKEKKKEKKRITSGSGVESPDTYDRGLSYTA